MTTSELTKARRPVPEGLVNSIALWADGSTDATTKRRGDLLRDKTAAVADFFDYTQKHPGDVTPLDVATWQAALADRGLSPATIYARVSRLSAWYNWALTDADLAGVIRSNPVNLARPKAPKAYQGESTKSLSDEEITALLAVVRTKAAAGDLVAIRDNALLVFYLATGWRRQEIIALRWGDLKINGGMLVSLKVKGGERVTRTVEAREVRDALVAYLVASGRKDTMQPDSPLWLAHDRTGANIGQALTSHGFAKRFKYYAKLAGLGDVHLHQLRHTVGRIISEESGSLQVVQEVLGHKNLATTRVYVQRIGVQRDQSSRRMAGRLGL